MNKTEFIDFIASQHAIKKTEAEKSLNQITEAIIKALSQGEEIKITGFGIFEVKQKDARSGHHPKTGVKIDIPAYKQPVFKIGKTLKRICNANS